MARMSDLPGTRASSPSRRLWIAFPATSLLVLLFLISIHACSIALRRANNLGRSCVPPPEDGEYGAMEARIAMVSFSDEGDGEAVEVSQLSWSKRSRRSFKGLMKLVKSNKESYARMWGYDFIDARGSLDRSRPASWSKIPAVRTHLGHYDWVFWNDADSLVTNPSISLERILQSVIGNADLYSSPDLILTEDVNGINAGMFFVRRSRWSESFLDLWWNQTAFVRHGSTRSGDNAALIYLIKSLTPEEMRAHVRVAPMQCLFNSYPWFLTWKSLYRLINSPTSSWKGAYSPGDFMVHLAGLDDKTGWVAKFLGEI